MKREREICIVITLHLNLYDFIITVTIENKDTLYNHEFSFSVTLLINSMQYY